MGDVLQVYAELCTIPDSQFLQPVEAPLDGGKLSGISATFLSFVLTGKLAESKCILSCYLDHQ